MILFFKFFVLTFVLLFFAYTIINLSQVVSIVWLEQYILGLPCEGVDYTKRFVIVFRIIFIIKRIKPIDVPLFMIRLYHVLTVLYIRVAPSWDLYVNLFVLVLFLIKGLLWLISEQSQHSLRWQVVMTLTNVKYVWAITKALV